MQLSLVGLDLRLERSLKRVRNVPNLAILERWTEFEVSVPNSIVLEQWCATLFGPRRVWFGFLILERCGGNVPREK
jgi:hypothetical protein